MGRSRQQVTCAEGREEDRKGLDLKIQKPHPRELEHKSKLGSCSGHSMPFSPPIA
jgi:hypothetical protein